MEYPIYAEQTYRRDGIVEARILTAAAAHALGYEDGGVYTREGCKVYVDGFATRDALDNYLSDLMDCIVID